MDKIKEAGRLQQEGLNLLRESTQLLQDARSIFARGENEKASELMKQSATKRHEAQALLDKAAKLRR